MKYTSICHAAAWAVFADEFDRLPSRDRTSDQRFNGSGNITYIIVVNGFSTICSDRLATPNYLINSRNMEMTEMIAGLSALAQPTRYRCVAHLAEHGECSAGDLATAIGVPANTMSSHLTILSHAGLVTSIRSGRHIVYRAKSEQVAAIREALAPLSGLGHETS